MNCPRDNTILDSEQKGSLDVNVCPECNGFAVLLGQEAATALSKQLKVRIDSSEPKRYDDELRSPFTGHLMKRFKYREVELDYCEFTDSVWFDRGEYSKMFQSSEGAKRMKGVGQDVVDSVGVGEIVDSVADAALDFSMVGEFVGDFLSNFEVTWDPWD